MPIAVIVPCFRQSSYLPEAIASVREQTLKPDEVIVGAGDDEAARAGAELGVRVVRVGRGLSTARNEGTAASSADLILPLDADDRIAPTFLERTAAAIEGHDIAGTWLHEFGDRHGEWRPKGFARIREENGFCCATLFRRHLWERHPYDPAAIRYEDWSFWLSAGEAGARGIVLPERLFLYRIHGESMTTQHGHMRPLWEAMLRLRHPTLYGAAQLAADRVLVAAMPAWVADEVVSRLARYPDNPALREAAKLAGR